MTGKPTPRMDCPCCGGQSIEVDQLTGFTRCLAVFPDIDAACPMWAETPERWDVLAGRLKLWQRRTHDGTVSDAVACAGRNPKSPTNKKAPHNRRGCTR